MNDDVTAKPKMGRPSDFTQEMADRICHRLMEGESLRKICEDDDMPGRRTVFGWINSNNDFAAQYEKARQIQFDSWADEIKDIADKTELGKKTTKSGTGDKATTEVVEADMVEHRKLRIDARKWLLSKLHPKRFGELIKHNHSGPDDNPIPVEVTDARQRVASRIARISADTGPKQDPEGSDQGGSGSA